MTETTDLDEVLAQLDTVSRVRGEIASERSDLAEAVWSLRVSYARLIGADAELSRLEVERDEARRDHVTTINMHNNLAAKLSQVEAERDALRAVADAARNLIDATSPATWMANGPRAKLAAALDGLAAQESTGGPTRATTTSATQTSAHGRAGVVKHVGQIASTTLESTP